MSNQHTTQLLETLKDLPKVGVQIDLDGNSLTIPQIVAIANHGTKITCSLGIRELLQANSDYLRDKLKSGSVVYGVNTGFGGSADVRSDDLCEVQKALLMLLNAGFGDKLDSRLVRAVMVVRANSLCNGMSGVRPEVLDCLLFMINNDIIPVVPKRGSISASGDLMPNSYIASCMTGRSDIKAIYKGREMTMSEIIQESGMKPVTFQAKEALAIVNAASFAASLAACLLYESSSAVLLTQAATALTVESLYGRVESFHPTIHNSMPHEGQIEVARNIRKILAESKLAEGSLDMDLVDCEGLLKQDRYALRTAAQWLSPTLDTLTRAMKSVTIDLNSVCDNPLVDHRKGLILHGGNFQGTEAAVAMDQVRQSLQICGKLLFAQFSEVVDVSMNNNLTPNLCGMDPRHDFGFKGVEIAMAAYTSELDYLTAPLTNHVLSAELRNQSVNSLALISARMTEKALKILQMMLACMLLSQVQAHDLRWLQMSVNKELKAMVKTLSQNGVDRITDKMAPWYEFAFRPITTGNDLMKALNIQNGTATSAVEALELGLVELLADLKGGRMTDVVANCLGKGTRQLYLYIRRDLKIPYCCGRTYLDTLLETIFVAIRGGKLDQVLIDMFSLEDLHPMARL